MKFSKIILEIIRWTLITLSIVAIVLTISAAIKSPSFHDQLYRGFVDFVSYSQPFALLFAATFVVLVAGLILRQFKK